MSKDNLPSQTINPKGHFAIRPEDLLEINQVHSGTVLHFQNAGEVTLHPVELINTLTGTHYITPSESAQCTSNADVDGDTYIFNQDTGEVQLINLSGATTINSNEVEIITVDGNSMLTTFDAPATSPSNLHIISRNASSSRHPHQIANAHEDNIVSPSEVIVSTTSSPRMKSAPALLRNSRRLANVGSGSLIGSAQVSNGTCDISSNGNNSTTTRRKPSKSKSVSRPVKRQPKSKLVSQVESESRQVVLLENGTTAIGQISQILESYPISSGVENAGEVRSGYFVIGDGQNVAELFTDSYAGNADSIIYQLDDSNTLYLNDSSLSSLGNVPVKSRKREKCVKKPKKTLTSGKGVDDAKKKNRGGGASELKCMEIGCSTVTCNVAELRKHLTIYHDMSFDLESKEFHSDTAFKEWRQHYERDRMVSFIYRGGTKKISKNQSVTYMICHRSGHYKPTMIDTAKRKRKMKPQGSCKIGGYCTAGIKLLRNLENGSIQADICHTHYGHPLDSEAIPHLRVNPVLKRLIIKKFEEGLTFADMLAYIHHNPHGLEGLRVVDRRAVRNIYDTWKKASSPNLEEAPSPSKEVIIPSKLNETKYIPIENVPAEEKNVVKSCRKSKRHSNKASHFNPDLMGSSDQSIHPPVLDTIPIDESAPVLSSVNDIWCNENEADEDPPLLIAIASVKSLHPEEKINVKTSNRFKHEVTALNEGRSQGSRSCVKDPIIVKTESICCSTKPSSKLPKKCRPINHRTKYQTPKLSQSLRKTSILNLGIKTSRIKRKQKLSRKLRESERVTQVPVSSYTSPCTSADADLTLTDEANEQDLDSLQICISTELEATIDKLHNHGEAGPSILLYKRIGETNTKYGGFCRMFREDDFCLIFQTPVQRQIFQLFPKTVSIEILENTKPNTHGLKLAFLSVLDDFREAIPVAWMIADAMCPRYFNQFFRMLRYHCGELPVLYIMAPRNIDIFKIWTTHFSHKPKILQSELIVKRDLRILLNRHFPNDDVRTESWNIVENLVQEKCLKNVGVLRTNLQKLSKKSATGSIYLRKMEKDWFSRISEWCFAYRVGAEANLLFAAEGFIKLKKFVTFKGTKKLNQTIDPILKIGYDKCFLRTKRMFKGDQKLSNLLEKIDDAHKFAVSELKDCNITVCQDMTVWKIETELGCQHEVLHLNSPCNCKILCKICNICMHEYMCTCEDFVKQKIMCLHIHKIHCLRNDIPLEENTHPQQTASSDLEAKNNNECKTKPVVTEVSFEIKPVSDVCGSVSEITIINGNEVEELNISEVLGLLGQQDGQEIPKIVSITDVDTQQIIYDGSIQSPLTIFQLDSD